MDLNQITPIIEKLVKDTLRERNYPFGGRPGSVYGGLSNKVASGTLVNSVKVLTKRQNDINSIEIDIAAYGIFVEEGRASGKNFVPVSAIMQWLTEKGIGIRNPQGQFVKEHRKTKKKYEEAKKTGNILPAAFAIQSSIKRFGIRATNFTELALNKISQDKQILSLLEGQAIDDLMSLISVSATVK